MLKKKVFILFSVIFFILSICVIGVIAVIERDRSKTVSKLNITNLTGTGFTVSWVSNNKEKGEVIVVKKGESFGIFPGIFKERFYDDRDIEQNDNGEWVLKEKGSQKRYTHHVTIRGLEPETEYEVRIMGRLVGMRLEDGVSNEVRTQKISENLTTPDPAYGIVDSLPGEVEDTIVYFKFKKAMSEVEDDIKYSTKVVSSTLNSQKGYSVDVNPFKSEFNDFNAGTFEIIVQHENRRKISTNYIAKYYKPIRPVIYNKNSLFDDTLSEKMGLITYVYASMGSETIEDRETCGIGTVVAQGCSALEGKFWTGRSGSCNECVGGQAVRFSCGSCPDDINDTSSDIVSINPGDIRTKCTDGYEQGYEFKGWGCSRDGFWTGRSGHCNKCINLSSGDFKREHCGPCTTAELSNVVVSQEGSEININWCAVNDESCRISGSICHCSLDPDLKSDFRKDYKVSNIFLYNSFDSSCIAFCSSFPKSIISKVYTSKDWIKKASSDDVNQNSIFVKRKTRFGYEYIRLEKCYYMREGVNLPYVIDIRPESELVENVSIRADQSLNCIIPDILKQKCLNDKGNLIGKDECQSKFSYDEAGAREESIGGVLEESSDARNQDRLQIYKFTDNLDSSFSDFNNILGLVRAVDSDAGGYLEVSEPGKYVIYAGDNFEQPLSEFTIDTGDGTVRVKLFVDENGNGVKDEGETVLEDYTELKLKKESEAVVWSLEEGWNLINIPIISNEGVTTASELLDKFNSQGADIKHIARYTDKGFEIYTKREGDIEFSNDFNLVPGQGYFVLNYKKTNVSLTGHKLDESVPFRTRNGWNLVGIYTNGEKRNASDILKKMGVDGIKADIMSRYDGGRYESIVYENETLYGNDYDIVEKQGYFIRVTDGGGKKFTP